ncbi:hypothetical protein CWR43_29940 [Rhizobium sullae]|uniref:Uncharacterized protein n=2 Tax=Rhizobium sullae TaxID=50338 RepID=A0A2N0D1H9_RHISU|nr:hypothetical protein CWR43_29940 [Rhizobium sullae]
MFAAVSTSNLILKIEDIADRLGLTPKDFERYRQLRLILVLVETGSGEHEGLTRLTCQLGNRVWEAVLGSDQQITHEETRFLRGRLSQARRSK